MSERPSMCMGCGDQDYPHAFIWCHDYTPKKQAVSRQIPTIQLKDCGEERYEQTVHHPDDVLEIAKLRTALEHLSRELSALRRQQATVVEADTFTSVMTVPHG